MKYNYKKVALFAGCRPSARDAVRYKSLIQSAQTRKTRIPMRCFPQFAAGKGGEMESLEPKKLALIRILQILQKYSDREHHLKQEEIAAILDREYGITVERKAIGRNLSLLKEAGYDIESDRKGSWLDSRLFEDAELRMLIDGVLSGRHVTAAYSKSLIERLCSLSGVYFRAHVKHVYSVEEWSKTENKSVFYNIDLADEAIESGKSLEFDYNKYGTDGKLHKTASHTVTPYQMLLRNRHYYLMCCNAKWMDVVFYRMDRITNMRFSSAPPVPLNTLPGYEHGINYRTLASSLPYMFSGKPERIEFYVESYAVDDVIDWFGKDVTFSEKEGRIRASLVANVKATEYWAMQYLNAVEVISPASLREKIAENLRKGLEKYGG